MTPRAFSTIILMYCANSLATYGSSFHYAHIQYSQKSSINSKHHVIIFIIKQTRTYEATFTRWFNLRTHKRTKIKLGFFLYELSEFELIAQCASIYWKRIFSICIWRVWFRKLTRIRQTQKCETCFFLVKKENMYLLPRPQEHHYIKRVPCQILFYNTSRLIMVYLKGD